MAKIKVKNIKNEDLKDITLSDSVWNIKVNDVVLKKAIDLQMAATRQGTRSTKGRSDVSGGGRKPWKQKGTGRARQGSTRATQWVGGGVYGGVTNQDFSFKMNKKERTLALKSALTHKFKDKELVVVDSAEMKTLKTKDFKAMLNTLNLTGKVLFVTENDSENLFMASRNLGYAYAIMANEINCLDIVNSDILVVEEAAVKKIEEALK